MPSRSGSCRCLVRCCICHIEFRCQLRLGRAQQRWIPFGWNDSKSATNWFCGADELRTGGWSLEDDDARGLPPPRHKTSLAILQTPLNRHCDRQVFNATVQDCSGTRAQTNRVTSLSSKQVLSLQRRRG